MPDRVERPRGRKPQDLKLVVRSEFASAVIAVDETANGQRLRIYSEPLGEEIFLDPLEIEMIVRRGNPGRE